MKSVFKYLVIMGDQITIGMPAGAKVVHVDVQGGEVYLWAVVDTDERLKMHEFCIRGTGHPFNGEEGEHLGTFMAEGGRLVFHVFHRRST